MSHIHDAEIKAFLRGSKLQFLDRAVENDRWGDFDPKYHDFAARALLSEEDCGRFTWRIKPRTVKIGSREVEAPVLEPVDEQTVYWTAASGTLNESAFDRTGHSDRAAAGRLFASRRAAVAFHEASVAYILEQMQ